MRQLDYIAHHGILGMKWGIRRTPAQLGHPTPEPRKLENGKTGDYKNDGETVKETYGKGKTRMIQSRNEGGSLSKSELRKIKRETKRARNNYDYRESDEYKNANKRSKYQQEMKYYRNQALYGTKKANHIEYDTRINKADRKTQERNALKSKIIKSLAIAVGTQAVSIAAKKGLQAYAEFNVGQEILNKYNGTQGQATVNKKGINFDFKRQRRVMELGRAYLDSNGYYGQRGLERARRMSEEALKAKSAKHSPSRSFARIGKAIIDM